MRNLIGAVAALLLLIPGSALAAFLPAAGGQVTVTATVTRPADVFVYAPGDAMANSTSAPTAGGLTFTSVVNATGKAGVITDLTVINSVHDTSSLQGELWLYDTAPTAINDNAAFSVADSEDATLVAIIPFTTSSSGTLNDIAVVTNIGKGFVTVGNANLRGLVKVLNAYTPSSAAVLTFRLGVIQTN